MDNSQKIVFPPLNFAPVLPGVYRCGHPNERNFPFLDTLHLRSIMYLSSDDYRPHTLNWANEKRLNVFHHKLEPTKEPFAVVDEDAVVLAIEQILDSRNLPILIHDNKGRLLPSILSAILRRLSHWSFTATLQEYRSFLPAEKVWTDGALGKPEQGRERAGDLEFIERFDIARLTYDPRFKPDWLDG